MNNKKEIPSATDYSLSPTLSALTGSDVLVTGHKKSGEPFDRQLDNISVRPTRTGVMLIGLDPVCSQVRQFDLGGVETLRVVGGATYKREQLLGMLDEAIATLKASMGGGK